MFYIPRRPSTKQLNYKDTQILSEFIHDTLVILSKDDITKSFSKEFAFKVLQLVNTLRPMKFNQLNIVWNSSYHIIQHST